MSTHLQRPVTIRINTSGRIHDNDDFGSNEEKEYSWSLPLKFYPGSNPQTASWSDVCDNEVESKIVLTVVMDTEKTLYVSGNIYLLEGYYSGREVEAEYNFGAVSIQYGIGGITILHYTIRDSQGDWASVTMHVENPG